MRSVVLLHIYLLGGPFTLMVKILESLVTFRPLGGPSTLWTCRVFYPLEGPANLRSKILEPFWEFSPFTRSIHSVDMSHIFPSLGSIHFED